jgi:hypothetical protein
MAEVKNVERETVLRHYRGDISGNERFKNLLQSCRDKWVPVIAA